jgi:hypothetical protein
MELPRFVGANTRLPSWLLMRNRATGYLMMVCTGTGCQYRVPVIWTKPMLDRVAATMAAPWRAAIHNQPNANSRDCVNARFAGCDPSVSREGVTPSCVAKSRTTTVAEFCSRPIGCAACGASPRQRCSANIAELGVLRILTIAAWTPHSLEGSAQ